VQEVCCGGHQRDNAAGLGCMRGQSRAVAPEIATLPLSTEAFARHAAEHLRDEGCLVVVFQPWSETGGPPPGILAPAMGGEHAILDVGDFLAMIQGKHTILMPCTFATESERTAAQRIVAQFADNQDITLLMTYVKGWEDETTLDDIEEITGRFAAMLDLPVDDVITFPSFDSEGLRGAISLAKKVLEVRTSDFQRTFDAEPQCMEPEDREALQQQYDNLMWTDIPQALMPQLPRENPDLLEGDHEVGNYRFLGAFQTPSRSVVHAVCDESGTEYAIKAVPKSVIVTPADLECVYREYRFLSMLKHPNICHCHEMLHSKTMFYYVLDYVGPTNLAQVLVASPGKRLCVYEAIECFRQLVEGLAHCHNKNIVHRDICLQNLVLSPMHGNGHHCCLIDFSMAVQSCHGQMSYTVCGTLPCMAPEVAMGGAYLPRPADCWSMGVVLLEMGGGMSSLSRSVPFDPEAEPQHVAARIRDFVDTDDSHRVAFAHMNNVKDEDLIRMLRMVLVSAPSDRQEASDCLNALQAIKQQQGAATALVAPR